MKSNCGITQEYIISTFGTPKMAFPPPNWIVDSMVYLMYNFSNVKINIEFPHKGQDCLNSVVIDYTDKLIKFKLKAIDITCPSKFFF